MIINSGILPPPPVISTWMCDGIFSANAGAGPASNVFPASNKAYFLPISITQPIVITAFFCINGATASGNLDIGLFDRVGTRIISTGSTAQSGTSQVQSISVANTSVGPGLFYLALAADNGTGTFFALTNASVRFTSIIGEYNQSTAFPLPATATFATSTSFYVPIIGFAVAPNTLI